MHQWKEPGKSCAISFEGALKIAGEILPCMRTNIEQGHNLLYMNAIDHNKKELHCVWLLCKGFYFSISNIIHVHFGVVGNISVYDFKCLTKYWIIFSLCAPDVVNVKATYHKVAITLLLWTTSFVIQFWESVQIIK